tara:strand:+ start:58 stop:204 length:147 start_codon:yes stop_codon:yes gene_type:complete
MSWKDIIKKEPLDMSNICKKCMAMNPKYAIKCKKCGERLGSIPEAAEK